MEKVKEIWAALPVKKKIAVGVVAVFILLALVSGAKAQQNCGSYWIDSIAATPKPNV